MLIEKGADIFAVTFHNDTALTLSATAGLRKVVDLLIMKGADIHAKNVNDDTPLTLVSQSRYTKS